MTMAEKITDIDRNFAASEETFGFRYVDIRTTSAGFYGLAEGEYNRIPQQRLGGISEGVSYLSRHTSGGRIRFRTTARRMGIRMRLGAPAQDYFMPHMALTGIAGMDIFVGNRNAATLKPQLKSDLVTGEFQLEEGEEEKTVTLYLPLYAEVISVEAGLAEGERILPPADYAEPGRIVFYGSSITQGGCASKPADSYPAMAAGWLDCDFLNLGFSGNAKGERKLAELIAALPMDCFVYDYDHNAPDAKWLAETHLPFLKVILDQRPDLPVIIMSRPELKSSVDIRRSIIIQDTCKWASDRGNRVWFLDWKALLGADARCSCTVDGTHPNDLGFYRMARAVYEPLKQALAVR